MSALGRCKFFLRAPIGLLNIYPKRAFIVRKPWRPSILPRRCLVFYSTSTIPEKGEAEVTETSQKTEESVDTQETVENITTFSIDDINLEDEQDQEKVLTIFDKAITEACLDDELPEEEKFQKVLSYINKLNAINVRGNTEQPFTALSKYLLRNASNLDSDALIKSTELYIKVNLNRYVRDELLHSCLWKVRDCPVKDVFKILELMNMRESYSSKKWIQLTEMCKDRVRSEVMSISSAKQLCAVLKLLINSNESAKVIKMLEESAIVLMPTMDGNQISTLLYFLACKNSRNSFLRKAAVTAALNKPLNLKTTELENLFFSCAKLNIHNEQLLSEMTSQLTKMLTSGYYKQKFLINILISCSFIGWWKSPEMDDALKYFNTEDYMDQDKRASLIIALARLNVQNCEEFLQALVQDQNNYKNANPSQWLDVVHSLACVKQADESHLKLVLDQNFYESLLQNETEKHPFQQLQTKKKLLNILGCLCIDHGHRGEEDSLLPPAKTWQSEIQQNDGRALTGNRVKNIRKALSSLVPSHVRVKDVQIDQYGNRIDFEVITIPECEESKRVLIKVIQFSDLVHGGKEPRYKGIMALNLHQLSQTNTDVVTIPYHLTENDLGNYLLEQLKDFIET